MTRSAARWQVIAESSFAWEREALDWLRSQLPDRYPWCVWANFEFIDDEGKVHEVDARCCHRSACSWLRSKAARAC